MRTGQPAAGPVTSPPSCGWRGTCWPAFPIANRDPAITMAESARWPPFRAKPSVRVAGPSSRIPVARRAPWPQVRPCPLTCLRARRCKRGRQRLTGHAGAGTSTRHRRIGGRHLCSPRQPRPARVATAGGQSPRTPRPKPRQKRATLPLVSAFQFQEHRSPPPRLIAAVAPAVRFELMHGALTLPFRWPGVQPRPP
jgi:hypothetical protein